MADKVVYVCLCVFCFCPLYLCYFSPIPPDFKFNPRQYVNNTDTFIRCQNSLPFTLAGLLPSLLLSPSSFSPSVYSSLSPLLSHGCFQTDPRPMCTRCPPQNSTPSRSLSLLTPLFDTDRWNCYQHWLLCLSLCLPQSTLSILSSSFLSLTKWKISREREREWVERERERDTAFAANIWAKAQGFPERHSQ